MKLLALASLALAVGLSAIAGCSPSKPETPAAAGPLYVYVGGTMRPAMEVLAQQYEKETGRKLEIDYGDSGANYIKAETTGRGDLYVGHDPFHGALEKKGLILDAWIAATLEPVIVVAKGNPKKIEGLAGLAQPGVRVVLTDAVYSTAGHVWQVMFKKAGLTDAIQKNVVTTTRAGGEAANAVVLGNADAAIVWNAVQFLRRDKLDAVLIEPPYRPVLGVDAVTSPTFGPLDMAQIRVTVDVLKSSKQPAAAKAFAEFVTSDRAATVWNDFGFSPAPAARHLVVAGAGDAKAAGTAAAGAAGAAKSQGPLLVYVGAGLRDAMEDLAQTFTAKTGIKLECDYGGSGMIISRLRLAGRGDLFFPGDLWYVEQAEKDGLVASKAPVCYFVPVILVPKGNAKNIRTLADFARPGLKVGLGDPRACQVGLTSEALFAKNKVDKAAIDKNLAISAATVGDLGVQVKAGQLDATIVWDAVAAQYADSADVVAIPPAENEVSQVAIATLKASTNPEAAARFVEFVASPEGQAIFKKHHYQTELPK